MTRLEWDVVGSRVFEAGVDQGVLYINGQGVPWNGLISVNESSSGGALAEYYVDGVKYLQIYSGEEFSASVDAFTYPDEFAVCDGTLSIANGLFITEQPRESFGFSYRSKVGNDSQGTDLGFKIHLVYNALAAPSAHQRKSLTDQVDPLSFSWQITTKPPTFIGYKPTAHLVIDSRDTPSDLLADILDILYGTDTAQPRQPSVDELITMFKTYQTSVFDAGFLVDPYYSGFDRGEYADPVDAFIDGGTP